MRRRFCFALDLKDDPALIAKYRKYHEKIWPEIARRLKGLRHRRSGDLPAPRALFMIMEVNQSFSFEEKTKADEQNPKVQAWEQLVRRFQRALPGSNAWRKMAANGTCFQARTVAGKADCSHCEGKH